MNPSEPFMSDFNELARTLRAQFGQSVALSTILMVLGTLTAVVLLLFVLHKLQAFMRRPKVKNSAERLFQNLVRKLRLSAGHRRVLVALVRDLRLAHPTAILLSEGRFDRAVDQWRARPTMVHGPSNRTQDTALLAEIRRILFPTNNDIAG